MPAKSPFKFEFLHPRCIGTWLMYGLIRVCRWLPRHRALAVGRVIGRLFYRKNRKRREIVRINLEFCFPDMPAVEREHLARRHFEYYGMNVIDLGLAWFGTPELLSKWTEIQGRERIDAMLEAGERILLISPHCVGMDLAGLALCADYDMTTMMKATNNPLLTWLIVRSRGRFGGNVFMRDQGIRPLVRDMRRGRICYFIPDEDLGPESSEFVPFFASERAMLNVISRLAGMTDARVVPMASKLDTASGKYLIEIGEPLDAFPSDDLHEDTVRVSRSLEWCIRDWPEQFMWTLRWFKTRPDGGPSPYDHLVRAKL